MKRDLCILLFFPLVVIHCFSANGSAPDSLPGMNRSVVITGVGDIMLGTAFPSAGFLPPHDNPILLLGDLVDTLAGSDVTFGNLEGSFLDKGEPAKKCRDTAICYLFRMPERYAVTLSASGFDVVSLANNHSGDFGFQGRFRTKQILDSLDIKYGGLIENPYSVFTRDSLIYGFCAFAPNAGTADINNLEDAEKIVRKLHDTCDIVIVSFHGGSEGAGHQRVLRKEETSFGEGRGDVYTFAHRMIDAGADVIFGHGPHVTRAVEVYNERFIAYSLGNFCTFGRFNLAGPNGIAPVVRLNVDAGGRFISGSIIPVYQSYGGGVRIDPEKLVIRKIRELVDLDFPESVITISENGEISYK